MKSSSFVRILLITCIIIDYFLISILDLLHKNAYYPLSIKLKFFSITLCFLLSLFIRRNLVNKNDIFLLQLGLMFTVYADFNFLFKNNLILGVFLFCIVQFIYIHRYTFSYNNFRYSFSFKSLAISLLVIFALFVSYLTRYIFLLASIYALLLLTSTLKGIKTINHSYYPDKNSYFIAVGMILFVLCDTNVALNFIFQNYDLRFFNDYNMLFLTGYSTWLFYIPSQFLLSLSGSKS